MTSLLAGDSRGHVLGSLMHRNREHLKKREGSEAEGSFLVESEHRPCIRQPSNARYQVGEQSGQGMPEDVPVPAHAPTYPLANRNRPVG
jgi:hypothetical protein